MYVCQDVRVRVSCVCDLRDLVCDRARCSLYPRKNVHAMEMGKKEKQIIIIGFSSIAASFQRFLTLLGDCWGVVFVTRLKYFFFDLVDMEDLDRLK